MKRIGKSSFNPASIESMGFKTFKEVYGDKVEGFPVDVAFKLITGKNPPKKDGAVRKTKKDSGEDESPKG